MTMMQQPIRLPKYTSLRHKALVKHFCLDLATVAGEELFADLLSNTHEKTAINIAAAVQAKFQEPVVMFLTQLEAIRRHDNSNIVDAAQATIAKQVARLPVTKKINYCRALVTCGLMTGPQVFPEIYVGRVHMIRHARGSISDNLHILVPEDVDRHELDATRNMQTLVTKMEADLGQRWRGSVPDARVAARDWPKDNLKQLPTDSNVPPLQFPRKLNFMMKYWENESKCVKRTSGPN